MIDINVNLNINLDMSQRMMDFLRLFAPDMPQDVYDGTRATRPAKPAEKPVEEPKPETVQSPIPAEKAAPAPHQAPAAPVQKEISDADLRLAVKAAKDKVGTDGVKALFHEFEIPNSSACPPERRSELMDRLNKLAA